jgi:hypothetical protein
MNKTLAFDMDGYELFEGDYVASGKKLYRINKINKVISGRPVALELMHVRTTKIVKRKAFEVERLD